MAEMDQKGLFLMLGRPMLANFNQIFFILMQ